MIAVDTSVAVAGFASWHEDHALAVGVLARRPRLIAHVAVETYAVLTRLPPPHRAPAQLVVEFLNRNFPTPPLVLPARELRRTLTTIAASGIRGGAAYDAVVAATAVHARATLATLDHRAVPSYEAVGARIRMLR